MPHAHEAKDNTLPQFQDESRRDLPPRPHPGEVVGGRAQGPYEVVGLDALSPLLGSIRFPATKEEVIAAIGQAQVPIGKFKTASAREIVERTTPHEFRSSMELEEAVKRIMGTFHPEGVRGGRQRQADDLTGRDALE